jgi:hypothetical protein
MKAGTVTVASYAEAIVDASIDVGGKTYTIVARQGSGGPGTHLGTIVHTSSALYAAAATSFTALVLPVDYVP